MHAVLLDKMKHDPDFDAAEKASDPLLLKNVIERLSWPRRKTSLFSTVYEQENTLFCLSTKVPSPTHNGMRGSRHTVSKAINYKATSRPIEHVAKETHSICLRNSPQVINWLSEKTPKKDNILYIPTSEW
jgi:hypothetical protein